MLYAPETTIDKVASSHLVKPDSKIKEIDVGEFVIEKIVQSYSSDARTVDTDMNVGLSENL